MDELRTLVEEGAVVLVGFDDEERRAAQACRYREVLRHAADQEARAHACMFQHPGQHAAGGGLAVGPGHCQHPTALQHVIGQPLRAGDIGQPLFSTYSTAGLPRDMALPITTRSGAGSSWAGSYPWVNWMPWASN